MKLPNCLNLKDLGLNSYKFCVFGWWFSINYINRWFVKNTQPIRLFPIGKTKYMGVPKKMNKTLKALGIIMLLVVSMLGVTSLAAADAQNDVEVLNVEINGVDMNPLSPDTISVELGETIDIEVDLWSEAKDAEDLKIEAWVGGYEYDLIEDTTSMFDLKSGVIYTKDLSLNLPSDMDVSEGEEYTLNLRIYDSGSVGSFEFVLFIERARHTLNLLDVEFDSNVNAGENLEVDVRVENFGENKEENIRVEAELVGVDSDRTYIDELAAFEDDEDSDESSDSASLTLNVGDDVVSGEYELLVTVSYNRGHDSMTESYTVTVDGVEAVADTEADVTEGTIIAVDSTSLSLVAGDENSLKVLIANLGSEDAMYTVAVSGTQLWADSTVSPSFLSVPAGQVGEAYVYLTAKDNAEAGDHVFTLQISEGDDLVGEASLTATVSAANNALNVFDNVGSAWKLAFVGLIVLIIIVGLFLAFRKMNNDDEDYPLEPKDGQTYY